ncbi:MAG: dodecin family protein [Wenzhouxiangellaceae bacterium]|nr:dodecin family protein [Wenzhouxiangellaceae bacterium]
MSIARVTEITATSTSSFEDAIQQAMLRACKTLKNVKAGWVKEQKVKCDAQGNVSEYRVDMKVTFILED